MRSLLRSSLLVCLGAFALTLAACSSGGAGSSGTGGSPGTGDTADLDAKNGLWLGHKGGKTLVLYTYKSDADVLLDVRSSPKGGIEGQYQGSRTGTAKAGYKLDLECLNPGKGPCATFGDTMMLDCEISSEQLVCGAIVFDPVTSDDISP